MNNSVDPVQAAFEEKGYPDSEASSTTVQSKRRRKDNAEASVAGFETEELKHSVGK